ncbi:amidohydrolase [Dissulfurispira thermophila]|uniref:Amidohydrolase n=1 Tax=Dissulfurispira thermophila TaxID=2715679 RepID=A0A7G1H3M5_9BACT|nr:nitrilase-related carbon-nitrogen hydrolase [Dissulfurispira thermophila]BCB96327.1 amidohydrolase [Dissulfurispira thermophila]
MEKNKLRVCLVSLNQEFEDKEKNKNKILGILKNTKNYEYDLAIFPEMTLTGYTMNTNLSEEWKNSNSLKFFIECSITYNKSIIFGISVKENNSYKNRACFINNKGDVLLTYDKIHPFSYVGEDKYFKGGHELKFTNYEDFNLALTICYDLRFPEIYSILSQNSELIINIANWPAKRLEHRKILLKSRAIENQVFMIGVNRIGKDYSNEYKKSSMLIYPSGQIAKPIINEGEIEIYEIEKEIFSNYRNSFPTYQDKRWELYYKFYKRGVCDAFKR